MHTINDLLLQVENAKSKINKNKQLQKIKTRIMRAEMNPLFKSYYSLKINKDKITKYKENIKANNNAIRIIDDSKGYITIVAEYYGWYATWDEGAIYIKTLLNSFDKLATFQSYYIDYNAAEIKELYQAFKTISNAVTKHALEDPFSEYNKKKRYDDAVNKKHQQYQQWRYGQQPKKPKSNIPNDIKRAFMTLGIKGGDVSVDIVKKAYKRSAAQYHPDKGGSHEKMTEINEAYSKAIKYLNRSKQ